MATSNPNYQIIVSHAQLETLLTALNQSACGHAPFPFMDNEAHVTQLANLVKEVIDDGIPGGTHSFVV